MNFAFHWKMKFLKNFLEEQLQSINFEAAIPNWYETAPYLTVIEQFLGALRTLAHFFGKRNSFLHFYKRQTRFNSIWHPCKKTGGGTNKQIYKEKYSKYNLNVIYCRQSAAGDSQLSQPVRIWKVCSQSYRTGNTKAALNIFDSVIKYGMIMNVCVCVCVHVPLVWNGSVLSWWLKCVIISYLEISQSLDVPQSSEYCFATVMGARQTLAPLVADMSQISPDSQSASLRQSSPSFRP